LCQRLLLYIKSLSEELCDGRLLVLAACLGPEAAADYTRILDPVSFLVR